LLYETYSGLVLYNCGYFLNADKMYGRTLSVSHQPSPDSGGRRGQTFNFSSRLT